MNTKNVILAVLGTVAKYAVIALVVVFICKIAGKAYGFGYAVFADQPISSGTGREVTVSITEGKTVKEIGEILESNGLVEDAKVFWVQNILSSYKDELKPGMYTLNTSMKPTEMMEIMSAESETESTE